MRYDLPETRVVFPRLLPVRSYPELHTLGHGELEQPLKGHGHSLYGLRPYQPGESSRMIHWRTSAKRDELMVKEMENEIFHRVTLVFENTGDPTVALDEGFELAVSQAASLAVFFIREDWEVELVTLTESVPLGRGCGQLREILHQLALIDPVAVDSRQAVKQLSGRISYHSGKTLWINREGNINPEVVNQPSSPGVIG